MIKIFLIFLLPLSIYASKILSYNIYDRTDRVDVMITFDTPYEGVIKQNISKSKILIKLEDAEIESSKIKNLSTKFLQSITITPMAGYTQIVASVPSSVHLMASKTSDAYGLRLRFTTKTANTSNKTLSTTQENPLSHLPTKSDEGMSQSYYIVVTILVVGIIILFILKRKINKNTPNSNKNPWLFKESSTESKVPVQKQTSKNNDISIRFQKDIDNNNSVIMLDFSEQSYLILMGANNLLLDKFTDNKPTTQEDFDSMLQSRHQELDDFLKVNRGDKQEIQEKEPLQIYKEKAASILYEDDN